MAEAWHFTPEEWLNTPMPIRLGMWKHLAMKEEGESAAWTPAQAKLEGEPPAPIVQDHGLGWLSKE